MIPYFGFARQDRKDKPRVAIGAKLVANMLMAAGVDRLMTMDLHADQIQGFFYMPVDNVYTTTIMRDDMLESAQPNAIVVSPDVGGVVRARAMSKILNHAEMAIIDKRRSGPNKSEVMHIIGEPKDRHCLLIDDIVDTAGTLCSAAKELKRHGALSVKAYVTHPVLSGPAVENIMKSELDEMVVTDTISLSTAARHCPKIRVLSLHQMLAKAMKRINDEESISSLFN